MSAVVVTAATTVREKVTLRVGKGLHVDLDMDRRRLLIRHM